MILNAHHRADRSFKATGPHNCAIIEGLEVTRRALVELKHLECDKLALAALNTASTTFSFLRIRGVSTDAVYESLWNLCYRDIVNSGERLLIEANEPSRTDPDFIAEMAETDYRSPDDWRKWLKSKKRPASIKTWQAFKKSHSGKDHPHHGDKLVCFRISSLLNDGLTWP